MTDNCKKTVFLIKGALAFSALCFFSPGRLFAVSQPGTTAANFLKIPVAVIPAAMGESYTAMAGPDSILYNPAGLGLLSYSSFSGSHNQYLDSITQEYAAVTYHFKYGTLGAAFSMLSSGKFTAYDKNDAIIGKTSTNHQFWILSFAHSWPHFSQDAGKLDPMLITPNWSRIVPVLDYRPKSYRVSAGVSLKNVSEKLDNTNSSAYTMDAGVMVILPAHFHVGASVLNMGGKEKFFAESYKLPRVFRAGIAKDFHSINDILIVTAASDIIKYSDASAYNTAGLEADIMRVLQLRIAYQFSFYNFNTSGRNSGWGLRLGDNFRYGVQSRVGDGSPLTAGFGLNLDKLTEKGNFIHGIRIDYAYLDYGNLGPTHRLGMQLIW